VSAPPSARPGTRDPAGSGPAAPRNQVEGDPAGGRVALTAFGEPLLWLTGGALVLCLLMILGLLGFILWQGIATFWPAPLREVRLHDGRVLMGEVTRTEAFAPQEATIEALPGDARDAARAALAEEGGEARRRLFRTGNFELSGEHFHWVSDFEVASESLPEWSLVVERMAWGRFYGTPRSFLVDGKPAAEGAEAAWDLFLRHHGPVRAAWSERRELETHAVGRVNRNLEESRLRARQAELDHGRGSPEATRAREEAEEVKARMDAEFEEIRGRIAALDRENARYELLLTTADGKEKSLRLDDVVRAYPANRLSFPGRAGLYFSRWWEFLADDPREANSEGGVFPAIFGTVIMTLLMCIVVVPFGVLAALYLREYARAGPVVSAVRIAVNNLAGVPSIVFGVFGLGFFCYIIGSGIDGLFFEAKLPNPTFGTGGILWASLTLALLTLPVVIVATEEALAAVPGSMREGSYACGASKWQTIRRIVLPRAMPGIMTGAILAMARGAGEVAPLMLVGAVKLAPELPLDGIFPWVHAERSFMHLGFHIYDLGFQSQNSEAAKPMVFTTTLLLILVILALNMAAVWLRTRLRRKFAGSQF